MRKSGLKSEDYDSFELRVECMKCKKRFDFADYLTTNDEGKHIAELVIEKCGGDNVLCDNCRSEARKVVEKGTFEFVNNGDGRLIADLELRNDRGRRSILKFKAVEDNLVTFEVINCLDY